MHMASRSARSVPGGSMPIRTVGSRGSDSLPTSVTQSLSHTQAESGKLSVSGDNRFSVNLGKGR